MCKPSELRPLVAVAADQEEVISPASRLTAHPSPSHIYLLSQQSSSGRDPERGVRRKPTAATNDKASAKAIRRTGTLALLGFCLFIAFFSLGTMLRAGVSNETRHHHSFTKDDSLSPAFEDENEDVIGLVSSSVSSAMLRKSSHDTQHHGQHYDQRYNEKHKSTFRQPYREGEMLPSIDRALLNFLSSSSFGREKVIELLVNEYTSPESPDTEMKDRLKNAIGVLELFETDGEAVGIKGHPYLFVGSIGASMNYQSLKENGITHIINWSSTAKCNVFNDIQYLCFPGIRSSDEMLNHISDLAKAVDFVESARKSGGKALSHCWYGRNRSVTLLVAYLMKYEGRSIHDALSVVQETRPEADPYRDVLKEYARQYLMPGNGSRMGKTVKKKVKVNNKENLGGV